MNGPTLVWAEESACFHVDPCSFTLTRGERGKRAVRCGRMQGERVEGGGEGRVRKGEGTSALDLQPARPFPSPRGWGCGFRWPRTSAHPVSVCVRDTPCTVRVFSRPSD